MPIVDWAISQALSYSVITWCIWVAVAFLAARFGHIPGSVFGHLIVGCTVMVLDVRWIQSEMARPGWKGAPDMDIVFYIGTLLRVLLISSMLLPVSLLGLLSRRRRAKQALE